MAKFRTMLIILLVVAALACGSQSAPSTQPTPASMDPDEVRAQVEAAVGDAVEEAVEEALVQFREQVSRQELREMVAEAIANQIDEAELGSKSVSESMAEGPTPITKAEVDRLIQAEIAPLWDEVGAISAEMTEAAKNPIPTPTPTPTRASTPNPTPGPTSTPSSDITLSPNELHSVRMIAASLLIRDDGRITAQDLSRDAGINEVQAMLFLESMVDFGVLRRLGTPPNVYYLATIVRQ